MAQYRNQPNFTEEVEADAPAREGGEVDQVALVKSYAAFATRAVKKRLRGAILTFVAVLVLAGVALALWPKTYRSESTMVFNRGGALDAGQNDTPFRGATDVVRRRESLLKIIRETGLVERFPAERSTLGRTKAWLMKAVGMGSQARPEDIESALVFTLNSALWTTVDDTSMTIGVLWSSADSAARIVTAAQKVVLHERHVAEIATIQEKMAILDGHSVEVRKEIDQIADQLKGARDDTIAEIGKATQAASAPTAALAPAPRRTLVASAPAAPAAPAVSEEELARQKEALEELKKELELKTRTLEELKAQRRQSLATAQAQMAELLTKYTPAHPDVRRIERNIELLSQPSPQVATLEQETKKLNEKIKQAGRPVSKPEVRPTRTAVGGPAPAQASKPTSDVLPADILKLLESERESSTPSPVTAQLNGAVSKYAALRESIRQARVDLDTAQAAFAHRYKIVAPAEPPLKPEKPKPLQVIGIGILAAFVLAVAWPLVAELRTGVIVERWQVYQLGLPLLSEMRLPPGHSD